MNPFFFYQSSKLTYAKVLNKWHFFKFPIENFYFKRLWIFKFSIVLECYLWPIREAHNFLQYSTTNHLTFYVHFAIQGFKMTKTIELSKDMRDRIIERRHGWTAEEIRSHWNWAPGSSFLNNSEFSLTWRLVRNALSLRGLNFKAGLADMPDCPRCGSGLEETAEHAFYYCERVRPFWDHVGEWTARIEPKQLVLLDVGYVVNNVLPPFQGEKRVVFLAILVVARMVVWTTRNKGFYDDANFSHRDLVLFFRHLLRVKIRCDRKRLDRIKFSKRWVNAASLVVRKGAMLESSFPPLPTHGVYGTGP